MEWYHSKRDNPQGLIICEETGRNVAISYDVKDAPLIANAPALRHAAQEFIEELDSSGDFENWERCKRQLRAALDNIATEEKEL